MDYEEDSDEKSQGISTGIGIGIAVGMILGFMLFNDKYEGQTAREWFDEYDWVVACIEESNNPKEDCI
ncbi:MAG: hypothetical protein Q7R49_03670 [Candidatus Daviesbacteria bacterium]|nr:hypothetical protein [Candidatus Daviesbacteria bacterium]